MDIKYYQEMRKVDRLSKCFKHRRYNLMEHQYFCAMLFKHFASKEDISYGMFEFDIVLHHDVVETISMDLSWDIKNLSSKTKKAWEIIEDEAIIGHPQLVKYSDKEIKESLSPIQHALFKSVDMLDLFIFIKEEQELGNSTPYIREVEGNCFKILHSLPFRFNSIEKYMENYGK